MPKHADAAAARRQQLAALHAAAAREDALHQHGDGEHFARLRARREAAAVSGAHREPIVLGEAVTGGGAWAPASAPEEAWRSALGARLARDASSAHPPSTVALTSAVGPGTRFVPHASLARASAATKLAPSKTSAPIDDDEEDRAAEAALARITAARALAQRGGRGGRRDDGEDDWEGASTAADVGGTDEDVSAEEAAGRAAWLRAAAREDFERALAARRAAAAEDDDA